jgi:hypothetical protein
MTGEPPETLRRIEQRLAAASDAAERLIAEAARAEPGAHGNPREKPPPAGWQVPSPDSERSARLGARELELLLAGVRLMGEVVPAEVLERLTAALRELLLAARALIDFYLERLERPPSGPTGVQDIPID